MVNTLLLKQKINDSGLKQEYIYSVLNVNKSTFWRKANNLTEFKSSEVGKMISLLNLSTLKEVENIFFTDKVS